MRDAESREFYAAVHLREDPDAQATVIKLRRQQEFLHPKLAKIVHVGHPCTESRGRVWLVLELLPPPLSTRMRDSARPLDADEILRIGRDLCDAFCFLHNLPREAERPFVHGFLHPGCIHRIDDGPVKVTALDVQLSARAGAEIPLAHLLYRSPECVGADAAELTPENDLWAIAGVMYALARVQDPTGAQSRAGIDRAHRQQRAEKQARSLEEPRLREILSRALSVDRGRRFATAEEFRQAIDEALWFKPGDHVGPYTVDEVMSCGSFSYNLKVTDEHGDPYHAVVHRRDDQTPAITHQGLRFEMRLSHSGLPRIVDVCEPCAETHGHVWFVREFLPPPLASEVWLGRRALTAAEVLQVGRGVCELFEYLHDPERRPEGPARGKPIVHGFLVPGYIHRTADSKLIRVAGMDVQVLVKSGTPLPMRHRAYRSPECLESPPEELTTANDLWALAGSMLFLATRQAPTSEDAASVDQLRHDHAQGLPRTRTRKVADARLRKILLKAFSRGPKNRFQTATEFRNAIENALGLGDAAASEPVVEFSPGDRLGDYTIVGVLSRGMISLNLKLRRSDGTECHGVVPIRKLSAPNAVVAHLRRLKLLNHPGLAKLLYVGEPCKESRGRVWFVRESLPSSPENGAMGGRRLPVPAVLRIGRELCHLFEYLHGSSMATYDGTTMLHGFLLPGYVYLAADGAVKVTGTDAQAIVNGWPSVPDPYRVYRSPECLDASPEGLTCGNDLWAIAGLMYRFAAAAAPTGEESRLGVDYAHQLNIPRQRAGELTDESLRNLLTRAFAQDPRDRFQTATEFRNAIEEALAHRLDSQPDPESSFGSPALQSALRHEFPYPIARLYAAVLDTRDPFRQLLPLLALLEGILQFVVLVLVCDYLGSSRRTDENDDYIKDVVLKGCATSGTWVGVLRMLGLALAQDTFSVTADFVRLATEPRILKRMDLAVVLRNRLVHGGSNANEEKIRELKSRVVSLLAEFGALKDWKLFWVEHVTTSGGLQKFVARLAQGDRDVFVQINGEADHAPESNRLLLVNLRHGAAIYLSPWIALRRCPTCGQEHMFHVNRVAGKAVVLDCPLTEYLLRGNTEIVPKHQLKDEQVRLQLESLCSRKFCRTRFHESFRHISLPDMVHRARRSLRTGERLTGADEYEIESFLVSGGMADIYRARRRSDNLPVAVKLLPSHYLADSSMVRRFEQEQYTAMQLSPHRNVVRTFDFGAQAGDYFIAMELASGWVDGGTRAYDLRSVVTPWPPRRLLELAVQMADALQHIHNTGIIHRDLKPANLLLFEPGVVKLADFGVSRSRGSPHITVTGMFVGTPAYISPEHMGKAEDLKPASDLYSLGVILYELATGKLPFWSDSPLETMLMHLNSKLRAKRPSRLNQAVPLDVDELILRLLEKNLAKRFATALELAEDAQRLLKSRYAVT